MKHDEVIHFVQVALERIRLERRTLADSNGALPYLPRRRVSKSLAELTAICALHETDLAANDADFFARLCEIAYDDDISERLWEQGGSISNMTELANAQKSEQWLRTLTHNIRLTWARIIQDDPHKVEQCEATLLLWAESRKKQARGRAVEDWDKPDLPPNLRTLAKTLIEAGGKKVKTKPLSSKVNGEPSKIVGTHRKSKWKKWVAKFIGHSRGLFWWKPAISPK